SNARLLPKYRDQIPERKGWEAMYWSPLQGVEHLATRESVALYELSSFVKIEVSGPGAADYLDYLTANQVAGDVGKIVYTSMLNERGGIKSDLTVSRLAEDRFWLLTGGGTGMIDLAWVRQHMPKDGSVHVSDISSSYTSVGLWGPNARAVLEKLTEQDISNQSFPYFTLKSLMIETIPAIAFRISYVGELGWEIYVPTEYGARLWDVLWQAGQEYQIIPGGMGAFDSLRLEKGYRALGSDIHVEHNPYEAGLGWAVRMAQNDFIGREALSKLDPNNPDQKLCCLTMENGMALGKEPVFAGDECVGYITSANFGYSVGKHIAYAYLPTQFTSQGTTLEIEYLGKRYPAQIDADPLFDPGMKRLRA
ncbi:MAG: aminomethyltransferase family protein, partial [Anaerolineales bacterium]